MRRVPRVLAQLSARQRDRGNTSPHAPVTAVDGLRQREHGHDLGAVAADVPVPAVLALAGRMHDRIEGGGMWMAGTPMPVLAS